MLLEFETSRLMLRQWQDKDYKPFASLNADARVMEYLPAILSPQTSDAMVDRCRLLIRQRGWGFWAVELKNTGQFIGFVGLHTPIAELPFSPCVEIGWRLAYEFWGKGYATEAAEKALTIGFSQLQLTEIVAFTVPANQRSQAVMKRLAMHYVGTFEHPMLASDSPLRTHYLYKILKENYLNQHEN